MKSILRLSAGAAVAMIASACADFGSSPSADVAGAVAAFQSVPAGFSATSNSFDAVGDLDEPFHPHRGHGRPDRFGFLMGGGIGPEFLGEIGFGPGRGRGPFRVDSVGTSCVFSSTSGIVTCGPITRGGLTVTATAQVTSASGAAQSKIDSTTDKVVLASEVSGTKTRRDRTTSEVAHKSNRTITGLSAGSTQRTVDGTSVGTENTTGTTDGGAFSALRAVSDTTTGIIIPLVDGRPTYPSAGRVSRNMRVTVTIDGATTTHSRSEVVTYDGTATAKVVITQDGATKNCALPLPRGRLSCE